MSAWIPTELLKIETIYNTGAGTAHNIQLTSKLLLNILVQRYWRETVIWMDSWSVDATPGSNLAHENAHGIYLLSRPVSLCSSKITAKYFKKTFQKTKAACPKNGKGWHSTIHSFSQVFTHTHTSITLTKITLYISVMFLHVNGHY